MTASELAGPRKAAILLLAVGEQRAAQILDRLSSDEAEALSLQIATAPRIDSVTVRTVVGEAIDCVLAADYIAEGGIEYARATLERSLGAERAAAILERLTARLERRPFEFLRRSSPEQIATLVRAEPPQTAALIIAHLNAQLAAEVLTMLEEDRQADVAARMATLNELRPDVVKRIEDTVRQRLPSVLTQRSTATGGTTAVAQILASAGRGTERDVLDRLSGSDPDLAEEIRSQLFTFEDIVRLDDRAIQAVLRELDPKDLPLALRGVDESVAERILGNMSQRAAELLREEIAYQAPQRRAVVEEAQGRVVAVIRRLEESDAITLSRGSDDELL